MPEKPLIFISYSRRNAAEANMLEAQLNRWRFRPWVDRQKLIGGQLWNDQIQQAITQCELFLLVLTQDALASAAVLQELRYARSIGKRILVLQFQTPATILPEIQGLPIVPFAGNLDRSLTQLYDAIDRFGIDAPPLSGTFNGERALAVASFHRAPATWQIYTVAQNRYWLPFLLYLGQVSAITLLLLALLVTAHLPRGAIIAFFFAVGYTLIRTNTCLEMARGIYDPEQLVITPDGFVIRALQLNALKATFSIKQYAFSQLKTLQITHPFPGVTALRIASVGTTPQARLIIPGRFRRRQALAEQIIAAFQVAQKQAISTRHPFPLPTAPVPLMAQPAEMTPNMPSFPPPVSNPRLFLCATVSDHAFVRQLQRSLRERHLTWHTSQQFMDNPAQIGQAMAVSAIVFVVVSAASLQSDEIRRQYLYALGQRKIVIPLLIAGSQQNLPAELKSLQWIDCTKQANTEIWRLDIINALARIGIFQADHGFDGELTLAQALRQQLPPGCQSYRVAPAAYQTMRMDNINRTAIAGALTAILASILLFALAIIFLLSLPSIGSVIGGVFLTLLAVIASGVMGIMAAALLQRNRLQRWLQREKIVPELCVITPAGFAIHAFTIAPFPHMQSRAFAFATLADMRIRKTLQQGLRITMISRARRRQHLALRPEFDVTDEISDRLLRAFADYRIRQ